MSAERNTAITSSPSLHLAVALDGAGFHPAAWRDPSARPAELFSAASREDLAQAWELEHLAGYEDPAEHEDPWEMCLSGGDA